MVVNAKIKINARLFKALSFIKNCGRMADIGSDHGYSSIFAIQNGIAESVIATDISAASLAKTRKLVADMGLSDKITCREGNGLSVLSPGEADAALIAGMGADLIADIVLASPDVAQKFDYMALQPMNTAEPLRRRLLQNGYKIDGEGIVIDEGRFYQIIKFSKGEQSLSDIQYELGAYVYEEKIPLCSEYIAYMARRYENIMRYVGENDTLEAKRRIEQAQKKEEEYRRALEWALLK